MGFGTVIPPEYYAPERLDDFIEWLLENMPGRDFEDMRDYAMKYWFQVNELPYDGEAFRRIRENSEVTA